MNKAILSIADLVVLPELDDSEFLTQLNKANTYRKDTIEALDQFDYEQSVVIENLHNDLTKIQQYINQVKTVFKSGKLQIDTYVSGDLKSHGVDELIKTDVEANSYTREELELAEQKRIEDLKNKLIKATSIEEYMKIANDIVWKYLEIVIILLFKKIGMNLDDSSYVIFLREPDNDISTMPRHMGYHSVYNEVVERALNKMDINQKEESRRLQEKGFTIISQSRYNSRTLGKSRKGGKYLWKRKILIYLNSYFIIQIKTI